MPVENLNKYYIVKTKVFWISSWVKGVSQKNFQLSVGVWPPRCPHYHLLQPFKVGLLMLLYYYIYNDHAI